MLHTKEVRSKVLPPEDAYSQNMTKAIDLGGHVWDSGAPVPEPPPPQFRTFAEYLDQVPRQRIMTVCRRRAQKANADRLMSGPPARKVTAEEVFAVMEAAQGRCCHCGSLCVESRPSKANGAPLPWGHVGRRIGSLHHLVSRIAGGDNDRANLVWSCLWCAAWPTERRQGAADHGGLPIEA
jgi:hypothetical protein